eukprot:scaffold95169_cov39-Phaeocystis_antarctica.AAC.2
MSPATRGWRPAPGWGERVRDGRKHRHAIVLHEAIDQVPHRIAAATRRVVPSRTEGLDEPAAVAPGLAAVAPGGQAHACLDIVCGGAAASPQSLDAVALCVAQPPPGEGWGEG